VPTPEVRAKHIIMRPMIAVLHRRMRRKPEWRSSGGDTLISTIEPIASGLRLTLRSRVKSAVSRSAPR
jgi:hypothetical protein